jgi:hypothetical protein
LWCFFADLEEVVGDLESTKAVYETMIDIKVRKIPNNSNTKNTRSGT